MDNIINHSRLSTSLSGNIEFKNKMENNNIQNKLEEDINNPNPNSPSNPDDVNPSNPDDDSPENKNNLSKKDIQDIKNAQYFYNEPSSNRKLLIAIIFGLIFAILSSPVVYQITNYISMKLGGVETTIGQGPTIIGLIIQTLIFIIVIRIILW
jgi:hypothetical protein